VSFKPPPIAKIFEALSAVADGRVHFVQDGLAQVTSSDDSRSYTVTWDAERKVLTSTDSASYWQGYPGYPVIAVLLALGQLPYDEAVAAHLAGIDWHALNDRFKRDYTAVVTHVLGELEARGVPREGVEREAAAVADRLAAMAPEVRRGRSRRGEGRSRR
jgi:hypothetical protein